MSMYVVTVREEVWSLQDCAQMVGRSKTDFHRWMATGLIKSDIAEDGVTVRDAVRAFLSEELIRGGVAKSTAAKMAARATAHVLWLALNSATELVRRTFRDGTGKRRRSPRYMYTDDVLILGARTASPYGYLCVVNGRARLLYSEPRSCASGGDLVIDLRLIGNGISRRARGPLFIQHAEPEDSRLA